MARASRKYSALEGYDNQYWPIHSSILAWRTPLTEKPGKPQFTGPQRVEHNLSNPACIDATLFFFFLACDSSAPVRVEREGGAAAWAAVTLVAPSVKGHRLSPGRSYGPISFLFSSLL